MTQRRQFKVRRSSFGRYYDFKVPEDCGLVIVCKNEGGGLIPLRCLLPHQVYVEDWRGVQGLTILPVKNESSIDIRDIRDTKDIR